MNILSAVCERLCGIQEYRYNVQNEFNFMFS